MFYPQNPFDDLSYDTFDPPRPVQCQQPAAQPLSACSVFDSMPDPSSSVIALHPAAGSNTVEFSEDVWNLLRPAPQQSYWNGYSSLREASPALPKLSGPIPRESQSLFYGLYFMVPSQPAESYASSFELDQFHLDYFLPMLDEIPPPPIHPGSCLPFGDNSLSGYSTTSSNPLQPVYRQEAMYLPQASSSVLSEATNTFDQDFVPFPDDWTAWGLYQEDPHAVHSMFPPLSTCNTSQAGPSHMTPYTVQASSMAQTRGNHPSVSGHLPPAPLLGPWNPFNEKLDQDHASSLLPLNRTSSKLSQGAIIPPNYLMPSSSAHSNHKPPLLPSNIDALPVTRSQMEAYPAQASSSVHIREQAKYLPLAIAHEDFDYKSRIVPPQDPRMSIRTLIAPVSGMAGEGKENIMPTRKLRSRAFELTDSTRFYKWQRKGQVPYHCEVCNENMSPDTKTVRRHLATLSHLRRVEERQNDLEASSGSFQVDSGKESSENIKPLCCEHCGKWIRSNRCDVLRRHYRTCAVLKKSKQSA
ncbi:uncharacterized protein LAESUDRAFT_814568 [Laetiporus sulphureus 93-53]|uniref:U1-type domain-containing protein n=1 Tax=Laetiporus sulphureus 93-53 TaxID=1314785 RepID=A0A165CY44_9APHY|nr:uncharacterized protein LAESUDRAFT_814568 [Laetiporus sulphureus 93-53]KZT03721.1 hypothetical protein LAESUDRAFT_814568 [Laetiporus sulphureus 93-53]